MQSTYSENLKKLRKELNLSAQKLADKLGVSQGSIAQYENGSREPNYNFILQLNIKLNVNLNWFCTGEGEMFNKKDVSEEYSKEELRSIIMEVLKDAQDKGMI